MAMKPPRLPRALIAWMLPAERRVHVLGDLDEEFRRHIVPARGRIGAARWYWRQAIASVPHALRLRHRRRAAAILGRDRRGGVWRGLAGDLAFALRLARRRPGYSLAVVATLAIGIGVSSAVTSVAYAVLGRPLPYRDPDRLVLVLERQRQRQSSGNLSWLDFQDIRDQSRVLASVAGFTGGSRGITGLDQPDRVSIAEVTDGFFATLGVRPALGRDFAPADLEPGAASVVILTPGAWKRRFGGDVSVIGRAIQLEGRPATVVGVLPDDFQFPLRGRAELFLPLQLSNAQRERRYFHWMDVVARLRAGASIAQANDDLAAVAGGFAAVDPKYHGAATAAAMSLADATVGAVRPLLFALVAAAMLLLVIGCINIVGLVLSRADARGRELSVRGAIGATRWRLARQLVVEHAVLALPAAALAMLLAAGLLAAFVAAIPETMRVSLPNVDRIGIDVMTIASTIAAAVAATLVFGLAPAVRAGRRPGSVLRGEIGETRSAGRARAGFVTAQVAMALMLLAAAGLLVQSVSRLVSQSHGFDPAGVLTMQMTLNGARARSADNLLAAHARILDELTASPGVTGAATIDQLPLDGRGNTGMFRIDGAAADFPEATRIRTVSRGYFGVMRVPLRDGRGFAAADRAGAPRVVLVNETLAAMAFAGDPIGRKITFPFFDGQPAWEIVGVVGDERFDGVDRPLAPAVYFSYDQLPDNNFAVVVRTSGDPIAFEPRARAIVAAIAPESPPYGVRSMPALVDRSTAVFQRRAALWLIAAFAATALVLVSIGLYTIVAQTVIAREREIGLRLALGAGSGRVLGEVLRRGLVPAAVGLGLGLGGCLAAGQGLSNLLFAIDPWDPFTLAAMLTLLAAISLTACLLPARRALRINPASSLRSS